MGNEYSEKLIQLLKKSKLRFKVTEYTCKSEEMRYKRVRERERVSQTPNVVTKAIILRNLWRKLQKQQSENKQYKYPLGEKKKREKKKQ